MQRCIDVLSYELFHGYIQRQVVLVTIQTSSEEDGLLISNFFIMKGLFYGPLESPLFH